jgi:hypothetical protein
VNPVNPVKSVNLVRQSPASPSEGRFDAPRRWFYAPRSIPSHPKTKGDLLFPVASGSWSRPRSSPSSPALAQEPNLHQDFTCSTPQAAKSAYATYSPRRKTRWRSVGGFPAAQMVPAVIVVDPV